MSAADMVIELDGARLRAWRESDALSLVRYANNRTVSRSLRDLFPYPNTEDEARRWLGTQIGKSPISNFAIDLDGEAIGSIGLHVQTDVDRRTAEIGYWLGEPDRGGVFARNMASARVLEKAGFDLEGRLRSRFTKDGEMMDELMYGVVRA